MPCRLADALGREQNVNATARTEIEDHVAGIQLRKRRGFPQPREASMASSGTSPACEAS